MLTKTNIASYVYHYENTRLLREKIDCLPDKDPLDPTALLDRWKNDNLKHKGYMLGLHKRRKRRRENWFDYIVIYFLSLRYF